MYIYFNFMVQVVLILLLLSSRIKKDYKQVLLFTIVAIIFSFLVAIRGDGVPDTANYISNYSNLHEFGIRGRFEFGFYTITKFFSDYFGSYYSIMFFFIGLFNISMIYLVGYKVDFKYPLVLTGIFLSYSGLVNSYVVLRLGIASVFIMYSWIFHDKKTVLAYLFAVISVFFHSSGIISLAILPLLSISKLFKFSEKIYYLLLAFSVLVVVVPVSSITVNIISGFLPEQYSSHLISNEISLKLLLKFFVKLVTAGIYIVFINDHKDSSKYRKYLNIYIIGVIIRGFFINYDVISGRVSNIFLAIDTLIIYEILLKYDKKNEYIPLGILLISLNLIDSFQLIT